MTKLFQYLIIIVSMAYFPPASAKDWYVDLGFAHVQYDGMKILGEDPDIVISAYAEADAASNVDASTYFKDTEEGSKIALGYQFNDHLAIEGGWIFFGHEFGARGEIETELTGNNDSDSYFVEDTHIEGITMAAVGRLPLNRVFALKGKAGMLSWDRDVDFRMGLSSNINGVRESANYAEIISDDGNDFFIGLGLELSWFNLFYDVYDIDGQKITFSGIGAIIRF